MPTVPVPCSNRGGILPPLAAHAGLWMRISAHPFASPDDSADFTSKLARQQGWTRGQVDAAIDEYRKFCFLAVVAGTQMVPSEVVDHVWHLHLTYTRDYWNVFCPSVLECELHHEPSRGRPADANRLRENYAQTLATYADYFGSPPDDLWPGTAERFRRPSRFRWIDTERNLLVPRPRIPSLRAWIGFAASAILMVVAPLVHAGAANPLDWSGGEFLILFIGLAIAGAAAMFFWRLALRNNGSDDIGSGLNTWEIAHLAGGRERVMDAAVAQLMRDGEVEWNAKDKKLKATSASTTLNDPLLDRIVRHLRIEGRPRELAKRLDVELSQMRDKLQSRGLLLDTETHWRAAWLPLLIPAALVAFGATKIGIGLSRGKPVEFLFLLILIVGIGAILSATRMTHRSVAGDRAMKELSRRHAHTTRAPRHDDLSLAVALAGTAVLSSTAYASYHQARQPASGGDGSDSGSSSGGDGGGGGCGGCGGGD
ncbi:MAG: TIGR04222 domain-containing membrane protein [Rudaea sp.]